MAADRRTESSSDAQVMRRRGVTLLEVIVTIAILATIAGVVALSVESSSALGGEAKRADDAARRLALIRDAAVRWNQGGRNDSSFTYVISGSTGGVNPGRLSELYDSITVANNDRNSCGAVFSTTNTGRWKHAFVPFALVRTDPRSTFPMATGYVAEDSLVRFDTLGVSTTATSIVAGAAGYVGTLAIVMKNVSLSDAKRLQSRMEGDQSGGVNSVVRFNSSVDPTTVYYHMGIHGC